ncbi:hypothetical protein [uncultured Pontibacter sp.]|uniref:hypothetical protein n=1 Tax=uncultured Pontibacter sp. TaxID=453356 RepID=UPI00261A384E|nr:hypothetical protein [uncultured Pontibacter sp.]
MSYADSLPKWAIWLCRRFHMLCLALVIAFCFDLFLLPRIDSVEKIERRRAVYHTSRGKFSNKPSTTKLDNEFLYAGNFILPFYKHQSFEYWRADSARFIATPIFHTVVKGYMVIDNKEHELKRGPGIFTEFMFIPICFVLVAVFGLMMWQNKEQLLNAAVFNAIVLYLLLWVMGFV